MRRPHQMPNPLQQPILLQEEHFEQIAHRFGVADDVVPDRLLAKDLSKFRRGLEDLELFFGSFGIDDTGKRSGLGSRRRAIRRVCFDGSSRRA